MMVSRDSHIGHIDFDILSGSSIIKKSEEDISLKSFNKIEGYFYSLRGLWSKACYLHFLRLHPDMAIAACSNRLLHKVMADDYKIYLRFIKPYLDELARLQALDVNGEELKNKLVTNFIDFGEAQFTIVCRAIHNAGYPYVSDLRKKGIILTSETLKKIAQPYE